ncbi:hypothetical protein KUV57_12160 [Epibacterium sp. DP7N7-1]|nr:hypothetical protein [Epibacterium sp. DP7N7-1]
MPAQDYPRIMRHLTPRRVEQFTQIVAELEAGRDAGSIANARYNSAKLPFSRSIEAGWEAEVQRPYLWNRNYEADERERKALNAFNGSPAPHLINSFENKAAAIGDTPAGRAARAFLKEVRPVLELMAYCKTIAVKKQPKTEAPTAREIYSAPAASKTAMGKVNEALQEITAGARDHIASLIEARESKVLERFLAAVQENLDPQEGTKRIRNFSPYEYSRQIGKGEPRPDLRRPLEALTKDRYDTDRKVIVYEAKPDAPEIMKDRAKTQAKEICAAFIERNLVKLASIVEAKGNFDSIEIIGRQVNPAGMDGRLRVGFDDGASFEARTSAVWSHSVLGKLFTRFPVTFHDVIVPGGDMTRKMSEQEMNEVFVKAIAPDAEDGPTL